MIQADLMKIQMLALLFMTSIVVKSQIVDSGYLHFIGKEMRRLQPNGNLYYADRLQKSDYVDILKNAKLGFKELERKGLSFNNAERKYIFAQLKRMDESVQADTLFPNSQRLRFDTLIPFVERQFRKRVDAIQLSSSPAKAGSYFENVTWAFSFSDPIYLRKKSILIYFFRYYVNSGGEVAIWVYQKGNDHWKRIGALGGGAW